MFVRMEEEWEEKNRERLIKSVLQANRLVQEANMLAEALRKDTVFKVTLTVPRSYLSPTQHVESQDTTNEVAIRVLHKQRGTDSVWTTDTLEEKVLTMREMYERMEEGGSLLVGPHPSAGEEGGSHPSVGEGHTSLGEGGPHLSKGGGWATPL